MKICPLCKIKYDDSAEFCRGCKAQLDDYEEVQKAENAKIPKSFWISLIAVCAFIGGLYLFYKLCYTQIYF